MTAAEARARIRECADLNAFISLTDEEGDGEIVAVKDLVDVRGTVTTGGGVLLPATPAEDDAPVIARLRRAGCVIVGKTNLHEWAFGVTSENPHYGTVRNPRAPGRMAGGSSGGSAAAVAAGLCDWAVGSDTGGSIRIPASFCGVVGFKPTIGSVAMEGVLPLSRTLDTLGPMAADVRTAARALSAMSDLGDLLPARPRGLDELRVAVARGWADDLAPEIAPAWERVSAGLPAIELPDRKRMGAAGLTILLAEAGALHRRWVERSPERYGADVLALLRQGLEVSRHDYSMALLEQSRIRAETEAAMEGWDAVLAPVTRVPPPATGETYERGDLTGWTRPFNTTGQPVITLPVPVDGLPAGIQVVGHHGDEATLVEVALALEAAWRTP
jgi:Asp-tRNA(Asn)/Glu-tRNA(Gln) amidotransferase A subunit family amidase